MKKKLVRESITMAQPAPSKPAPTKEPGTMPTPRPAPGKPSPIRRDRPSVTPRPKATAEEVAKKFTDLAEKDVELKALLKKKYGKK